MEARDFIEVLVRAGLTQVEIAARSGIPQPTISKVARGEVADVLSRNYRRLQALHDEVKEKGVAAVRMGLIGLPPATTTTTALEANHAG